MSPKGLNGPNDYDYMVDAVREAAQLLRTASKLYCEGHYPHSNAKRIEADHPVVVALRALAAFDLDHSHYANLEHNKDLFEPYEPSEANMHRWDGYEGPAGELDYKQYDPDTMPPEVWRGMSDVEREEWDSAMAKKGIGSFRCTHCGFPVAAPVLTVGGCEACR